MSEQKRRSPPRPKRPSPSRRARAQQQQKNHMHPFAGSSKVNFPGFDVAFNTGNLQRAVEVASFTAGQDPDRSTCSYGSSINNFSVDLSIGGRAALDEHRRHVNKYGIDGTPSRRGSRSPSRSPDTDDEWDRINDGNCSHLSWSTYAEEPSQATITLGQSFLSQNHDFAANSDFFNSSRVQELETPERNKPIVDEASRLAQLGEGHVTQRGQDESYADSVVGSNSAGSTECDDESGTMAFMFHEAMRLNEGEDDQHCSFEASFQAGDISRLSKEDSSESKRWIDTSSSGKASGSPKDSFVESEEGIECVADLSDIVPRNNRTTPSRNRRPRSDSYSTPQRRSSRTFKSPSNEKENADFNLIALSPIASKAGSIAAKMVSSGTFNYHDGTPSRTPSRRTRRLPPHSGDSTPNHAMTTPQQMPTRNSILNDSNFSSSTIEANNVSALSPMVSPHRGHYSPGQKYDHGSTQGKAADSLEYECESAKAPASRIPTFNERSNDRTFDDRQGPRFPVKSLRARYLRPDRFEDNFTPPPLVHSLSTTASEEYGLDLKSASKSLIRSFESSEF